MDESSVVVSVSFDTSRGRLPVISLLFISETVCIPIVTEGVGIDGGGGTVVEIVDEANEANDLRCLFILEKAAKGSPPVNPFVEPIVFGTVEEVERVDDVVNGAEEEDEVEDTCTGSSVFDTLFSVRVVVVLAPRNFLVDPPVPDDNDDVLSLLLLPLLCGTGIIVVVPALSVVDDELEEDEELRTVVVITGGGEGVINDDGLGTRTTVVDDDDDDEEEEEEEGISLVVLTDTGVTSCLSL
jgi:hypothetical protein